MARNALFYDVIKYDGEPEVLIYHHPTRDFNKRSTIQIQPSQEAFFYSNNQLVGHFKAGAQTVSTENKPILSNLKMPFHSGERHNTADVYFVNTLEQTFEIDITDCRFIDPNFSIPLSTGCYGTVKFKLSDPLYLILRAAGTANEFTKQNLLDFITSTLKGKLETAFSQEFDSNNSKYDYFNLNISKDALTAIGKPIVNRCFNDYGLTVTYFNIDGVAAIDLDNPAVADYYSFKTQSAKMIGIRQQGERDLAEAENAIKVRRAQEQAEQDLREREQRILIALKDFENKTLGLTEKERLAYEIAKILAGNPGNLSAVGSAIGTMGGMYSAGVALSPLLTNALNNIGLTTQTVPKNGVPVTYFGIGNQGGVGMGTTPTTPAQGNGTVKKSSTGNSVDITKLKFKGLK